MAELGLAPKGGGGQGNRSRAQTRVCGSGGRWRGVHSLTKKDGVPFSATACTKQASTSRPGRRGRQGRNVVARSGARKRGQRPGLALPARARECWGARLRKGGVTARACV
jgi:hypothetical protein